MIIHDENMKFVWHEMVDREVLGARPTLSIEDEFVAAIQLFTY